MSERASKVVATDRPGGVPASAARPAIAFDDPALVERCRKGDMQAFGMLVAKYQDRVYNLILRMCSRPADAEELAQETFLKALKKISQFRGQSSFYTWLFRIATNLTISHQRHLAVGRIRFHSLATEAGCSGNGPCDSQAQLVSDKSPRPEDAMMAEELNHRITDAIEQLDDEFRVAVVLRDVEEMDYNQIAEVLDVPIGTVKSRLHRGREILKEKLSDLMQP